MWNEARAEDTERLRWGISVMHELAGPSWQSLRLGNLRTWLSLHECQIHYYEAADCTAILALQKCEHPGDFQVMAFVIRGDGEPATTAKLLAAKLKSLAEEKGVRRVVGTFPKSSPWAAHFAALKDRPDMSITMLKETDDNLAWRFESRPAAPAAPRDPLRNLRGAVQKHAEQE